jgi:hemerythrin-like domain-containing protein
MQVFEILEREHDRILEMLDVLDEVCAKLLKEVDVSREDLEAIVRFFRRYADACHHAKEENILFPALESAGMPRDGGPIEVMLSEHVEGRALVTRMAQAAEEATGARGDYVAAGRTFMGLLRHHIEKENEVLFQMGRRLLAGTPEDTMLADYEKFESHEVPRSEKAELLSSLDTLKLRHT